MKTREIISFFLGGATQRILPDLIKNFVSKSATTFTDKIHKIIKKPPQADLLKTIMLLEPDDIKSLLRHLKRAQRENRERELVILLAAILPIKENGDLDQEEAKEILSDLAKTNPDATSEIFKALSETSFRHQITHELEGLFDILEEALVKAAFAAGVTAKAIKELDNLAKQKAEELNQTRFGRLANRLFR